MYGGRKRLSGNHPKNRQERAHLFVRIDKIDAGMNPRVKEVAVENLERMVLYEDLSQMNE